MALLVGLALLATMLSLLFGISAMVAGHPIAHRSSDQWMFARIGFQAVAVGLLVLALFMK